MSPRTPLALAALLLASPACDRAASPPARAQPSAPAAAPAAAPAPPEPPALPEPTSLPELPGEIAGPPATDLVARVAALGGGGELRLPAGLFVLEPGLEADAGCATCLGENWQALHPPVTVGLRLTGKGIRLIGAGSGRTVIRTRSGYGIVLDGCVDCAISGLTITGGERDGSDEAADAALVVRNSSVVVEDCVLTDNVGTTNLRGVVGISGVVVREGGTAVLRRCRIARSSWDGIALLRGARAELHDVVIDGVDRPSQGTAIAGGRGVGVRVTGGSAAVLDGVLVARHAGGIAVYGPSKLECRESVIEESSSFGILAQADESGAPELSGESVLVHRTAAGGIAVRGPVTGRLSQVRLVLTALGGKGAGPCAPVAVDAPPTFAVDDVFAWLTGGPTGSPGDVEATAFRAATDEMGRRLAARPATSQSSFVGSPSRPPG